MAAKNSPKAGTSKKNPGVRSQGVKKETAGSNKSGGNRSAGKTAKSQSNRGGVKKQPAGERDAVMSEVYLMITLVVSLLLILSYINLCGPVGKFLNTIVFGMMGLLGYLFPFVLFFGIAFGLSNRGNKVANRKLFSAVGMIFVLTSLIQMISGFDKSIGIFGYFNQCANEKNGGGLLGSLLLKLLYPSFGAVATAVILIALLLICIMLITGKALFAYLSEKGAVTAERIRRERAGREQEEEENEEDEYGENGDDLRRPARIVTLNQDREASALETLAPGEEISAFGTINPDTNNSAQKVTFLDALKEKGSRKKGNKNIETDSKDSKDPEFYTGKLPENKKTESQADMVEVMSPNPSELLITGDFRRSDELAKEVNAIYEEELRRKFGSSGSGSESKNGVYGMGVLSPQTQTGMTEIAGEEDSFIAAEVSQAAEMADVMTKDEPIFAGEQGFTESKKESQAAENMEAWEQAFANQSDFTETVNGRTDTTKGEGQPDSMEPDPQNTATGAAGLSQGEQQSLQSAQMQQVQATPSQQASQIQQSSQTQQSSQAQQLSQLELTEIICEPQERPYVFPPIALLSKPEANTKGMTEAALKETAMKLQTTLESFGVRVTVTNVSCGPAVTRYELQPEQGVKVSKITSLSDDIKLNLAASDIRIEAPISGKAAVGIEVPNKETLAVPLREILDHKEFKEHKSNIAFAVGKDISGQVVVTDIGKMPHLLIAGATGSGKSVCINTLIMSILYKAKPEDVRLIMVDPKVVELSIYNGIPHLLIPVVTDPKKASAALNWAVSEMTDRYNKFAELGVRDLKGYNERVAEIEDLQDPKYPKLPQIVIIVDELADLMMVASNEVETAICRLAQMARAAGLHLIIATQRPSVNVITGVIKANIPSRIAFAVSSAVDSRTIIDSGGAESLLGKGDMLFFPSGIPKPIRVQGAFVSDKEVSAVVDFLKEQNTGIAYNDKISEHIANVSSEFSDGGAIASGNDRDDYFAEAGRFIIEKDKASIGMLQRVYKIGFNRAARIMDQLAEAGVVGPEEGTKPRKILMTMEEFEQYVRES